jgi:hypothetical protein
MRKLGISVYPEHASAEDNKRYIKKAHENGFSRIFTCLLSVDGDQNKIIEEFKETISYAKELNFEVIADVAPDIFKKLGISYDDLSFFKKIGVDGFRLDEGFDGNTEAILTFNPEDLMIELNVSVATGYLDNIISFHPDMHKLMGCHNFYPKKRTGLSREHFIKSSKMFKDKGLRVAGFINSPSATFGPWPVNEGLCTLEEHRDLPIDIQAKDLFYSNLVDDVIIANCFASDEELEILGKLNKALVTLDIKTEYNLSEVEEKIAFEELHFFRGDRGDYTVRSTMPRVKYKNHEISPKNTRNIKRGDVIIENSNYSRYKGELHLALKDYENIGNSNIIGHITENNLRFLDLIQPWQKFKLKNI